MNPRNSLDKRQYVFLWTAYLVLADAVCTAWLNRPEYAAPVAAPTQLSDQQFWNLSKESSEEDGFFRSDNLLSNETSFQYIIPDLIKSTKEGRVYLGVGPEQNFTYIAALKPAMAF